MRPISPSVRKEATKLKSSGLPSAEIARQLGISVRSIQRYWRMDINMHSLSPKRRGGFRRSKLADHDDILRKWVNAEPKILLQTIQQRCSDQMGISISVVAIANRLKRLGLDKIRCDGRIRRRRRKTWLVTQPP